MTKAELIRKMAALPDDAEIRLEIPSGDYWGTTLARPISEVGTVHIIPNAYHNGWRVVDDVWELDEEDRAEAREVFVIG